MVAAAFGGSPVAAQPAAVKNVAKSVFTLTTFRADGSLLASSHGVFVSETGEAVSDLKPFLGAARAVVIDQKGRQMEVTRMQGINELYDVARFLVDGKTIAAPLATGLLAKGGKAWLVGYHPKSPEIVETEVKEMEPFMEQYAYYIFGMNAPDNAIACPFVNEQGEVIGLMQVSTTTFDTHATDVRFIRSLTVGGLAATDANLRKIGIPTALPTDETQAQLALMMAGQSGDSLKYDAAITDFLRQFPQRVDGYEARARWMMTQGDLAAADKMMNQAIDHVANKDDAHYQFSKIVYDALLVYGVDSQEWTLDKAQQEIMKAIQVQDLPAYHQMLGQILFAKGEYQTAFDLFMKLHDDAAPNGELLYQAARCQQMMNAEPMAVVGILDRAIEETDTLRMMETAPYFLLRAEMYEQADSFRKAVFDYTRYEYLQQGNDRRREHADHIHSAADGKADARRGPDARRRRQTADRGPVAENDPRAEERNAADDLRRDTRRIRAAGAVEHNAGRVGQIREPVFGDNHRERRSAADDDVRTDARLLEPHAAFKADRRSADACDQDAQEEFQILSKRELLEHITAESHVANRLSVLDFSDNYVIIIENDEFVKSILRSDG